MAETSSREKAVYWIIIVLIAVGGGAALAYFFVTGRQTGTSLTSVTGANQPITVGSINTQSLPDIIVGDNNDKAGPGPIVSPPQTDPVIPPAKPNDVITTDPPVNPVNQVITDEPQIIRQNQVLTDQPINTGNDLLNRPVVSAGTSTTSLSSGSTLPSNSPTTGADVLVLSGIASLGLSGVATAMALRKPGNRSRKTRS